MKDMTDSEKSIRKILINSKILLIVNIYILKALENG